MEPPMSASHLLNHDSSRTAREVRNAPVMADAAALAGITRIRTSIGALAFLNGIPTREAVRRLCDNLDLLHGVDAFLKALSGVSLYRLRVAQQRLTGPGSEPLRIFFRPISSKLGLVTPKASRYDAWIFIDLENDGPMIIDFPPAMLGLIEDMWSRSVGDLGLAGPDAGRGGKYLLLPPHYKGRVPLGYMVLRPRTNGVWVFLRCLRARASSHTPKVIATNLKLSPLTQADRARATELVDGSQLPIQEITPTDHRFYEDFDQLVQAEPSSSLEKDRRSLFASIGIVKGRPFRPNLRMRRILIDAAAIGGATARAINHHPRDFSRSFDMTLPAADQ
jgi:hypothetical protein